MDATANTNIITTNLPATWVSPGDEQDILLTKYFDAKP